MNGAFAWSSYFFNVVLHSCLRFSSYVCLSGQNNRLGVLPLTELTDEEEGGFAFLFLF